MSETYYHQKYLKYKNKYLSLKTQFAGGFENGIAAIFGPKFSQQMLIQTPGSADNKDKISAAFGNVGYVIYQGGRTLQLITYDGEHNRNIREMIEDRYKHHTNVEFGRNEFPNYPNIIEFSQYENFDYTNTTHIYQVIDLIKSKVVHYNYTECKGTPYTDTKDTKNAINIANIGYNVYKFNAMSSNVLVKTVQSNERDEIICNRDEDGILPNNIIQPL